MIEIQRFNQFNRRRFVSFPQEMAILRQELVAQEELLRQESSLVEDVTKFVRHNFWDHKFNLLMSVVTKASFC